MKNFMILLSFFMIMFGVAIFMAGNVRSQPLEHKHHQHQQHHQHHHHHNYRIIHDYKVRVERTFTTSHMIFVPSDETNPRNKSLLHLSSPSFNCETERETLAKAFLSRKKRNCYDSSCCPGEDKMLYALTEADPNDDKVIINIGVNKGYNIPIFLQTFFPFLQITNEAWHQVLRSFLPKSASFWYTCGICNDCKMKLDPRQSRVSLDRLFNQTRSSHVQMLFADLNCENVLLVKNILERLSEADHEPRLKKFSSFLGYCAGLSKTASEISITKCPPALEQCGINLTPDNKSEAISVPLITVDQLIEDYLSMHSSFLRPLKELPQYQYFHDLSSTKLYQPLIDILLIDAEGYDPWVLEGSRQALQSRSVRIVIFEYGSVFPWNESKLQTIVSDLDQIGYDCHYEGENRLWKLTGGCWSMDYENYGWANILCVRREDRWYETLQAFVVRTSPSN